MTTAHPDTAVALPAPYGRCPYDPPPAYGAGGPVGRAVLPDGARCWVVTGHAEVRAVLADDRFSADARTPGFPFLSAGQRRLATDRPSFVRLDDPEHARLRRTVSGDFAVRRVDAMRPGIQRIVDDAVDRMTARGRSADLVADVALPVPSLVICLMLGVPYEDHAYFQALSRTLLDNTAGSERIADAHGELMGYFAALAARKAREPGDDILSRLAARPDLGPEEVASLGFLLLVTGHESTAHMTALSVLALLRGDGSAARRLRAEPGRLPGAVEELLRYLTVVHLGLGRAATADVEVGGVRIRAGEGVVAMLSTANRDRSVFEGAGAAGPDELDLGRDARRHLAFGFGVHRCLGHALARAELQICLETLLRRLPGLRLAVPEAELRFGGSQIVYGVEALPVGW
ncbi:cytochrome P450 [Streptomyces sp. NPDC060194]|uniref:cytochrome P450 n=1 Tax=Streptomyces sp. NPDC060194 TaxID=3347069 RepID=UPI0036578D5D